MGLVLVTFGCAKSENLVSDMTDIQLSAETVSEGILLTFSNIPSETSRLFVHVQSWDGNEDVSIVHDIIASHSDIRGSSLEQVKQAGNIILPIVQKGQKYRISAMFEDANNKELSDWIHTECIADNGIYFVNNISLNLNDSNTGVTLSSEPVFSSAVVFDVKKYSFDVNIRVSENGSMSVGTMVEGQTWLFEPEMTDGLRRDGHLENGSYPAFVTARCNVIYDNIIWSIEISKTPEFVYTL
jgi:hypothetical protein